MASTSGVSSVAIKGDRNQIVVIGEGLDPIGLTVLLRKHMGHSELISVTGSGGSKIKHSLEKEKGKAVLESLTIDDLDPYWLSSVKKKLDIEPIIIKPTSTEISCSIHRVPQCFLQHYKKAYVPQVISIGPFHYAKRKGQLRAMEEHKWKYLRALVNRQKEENCLEQYLLVVKQLEDTVRKCYSEEIDLDSDSFAEMMLLDACFLIELFLKDMEPDHLHHDDPILRFKWLKNAITTDLIMLENQIPFFIMEHLFMKMNMEHLFMKMNISRPKDVEEMALNFFGLTVNDLSQDVHHLLHLQHSSRLPRRMNYNQRLDSLKRIHNASKLRESGIKFKKGDGNGFLEIRFRRGVIEIPPLKVEDTTNPLFLNLVAFEQCYRHVDSYFAGYTYFMDCLIDSANDVEILCQNGIIDRWLGSDEDVANLFNKMGREVIVYGYDSYLWNLCDQINRHHQTNWNMWQATLMRTYFNNPWATISVIGGAILLLLTLTQTFFTVVPKFAFRN